MSQSVVDSGIYQVCMCIYIEVYIYVCVCIFPRGLGGAGNDQWMEMFCGVVTPGVALLARTLTAAAGETFILPYYNDA